MLPRHRGTRLALTTLNTGYNRLILFHKALTKFMDYVLQDLTQTLPNHTHLIELFTKFVYSTYFSISKIHMFPCQELSFLHFVHETLLKSDQMEFVYKLSVL